jgi:hypothetical protein
MLSSWSVKMVVFVDLEDESEPPERAPRWSLLNEHGRIGNISSLRGLSLDAGMRGDLTENPNKNVITEALGCYPYGTHLL